MILVMGGTTEGRKVAVELEEEGFPVVATATTSYGEELLKANFSGEVLCGVLDKEDLYEAGLRLGIKLLVDATHPFALTATQNAWEACAGLQIPYLRLERDYGDVENSSCCKAVIKVESMEEAAREAGKFPGKIFLAVGSSSMEEFIRTIGVERIAVRILPTSYSLQLCDELNLAPQQVAAVQGPFSKEFNKGMFVHFNVSTLVTKESGPTGGLPQKFAAAEELGLNVILVKRPSYTPMEKTFFSISSLKEFIRSHWISDP